MGSVQRRKKIAERRQKAAGEYMLEMLKDKAGPFSTVEGYDPLYRHIEVAIRDESGREVQARRRYHLAWL